MATSGSVFSETLQQITKTKLDELSKRRSVFEAGKTAALAAANAETGDPVKRVAALASGVKSCFGIQVDKDGAVIKGRTKHPHLEVELKNLDRFLAQASYDPSVSLPMMQGWEKSLSHHLDTQSLKYQYATLYGQLVTEWLREDHGASSAKQERDGDVEMGEDFEDVGNALKLESRMMWEKNVFTPAGVDEQALDSFLADLFGIRAKKDSPKGKVKAALISIRKSVEAFEASLAIHGQFSPDSLAWAIDGLLAADLLSDEKREVLQDFKGNRAILIEIADVLNMRLSALDTWSWGDEVPLESRRKISGIYSITIHEDLLQALFLEHIGVKWSVFFKRTFEAFYHSPQGAWQRMSKPIPRDDMRRLGYYLGSVPLHMSLQNERQRLYFDGYFVSQLLKQENQVNGAKQGEEEAEYQSQGPKRKLATPIQQTQVQQGQQMQMQMQMQMPRMKQQARIGTVQGGKTPGQLQDYQVQLDLLEHQNTKRCMMARQEQENYKQERHGQDWFSFPYEQSGEETEDEPELSDLPKSPMYLKQQLLHMLSAEIAINTTLKGEISIFHSVFDNWMPLLPHETILAVLKLMGVSPRWLSFFTKFLRAPLKFTDDPPSMAPRERRRGTPGAHVLSDVFGEIVLFCLDFAVNQATDGQPLWRTHDDIWFSSADHATVVKAWKTVTEFATITGTRINERKTGAVRVAGGANKGKEKPLKLDASLPDGEIRWGFLRLCPDTGRFEIDQNMVDSHIAELRKQMSDKHSIFGFIQAWNSYAATFFSSNFGRPANCFGRDHVDQMLATHRRIQQEIFSAAAAALSDADGDGDKIASDQDGALTAAASATSVVDFLKQTLARRFGVENAPDGYLFFPGELGGLDLQSPFVALQQIRDSVLQSSSESLERLARSEEEAYQQARDLFRRCGASRDRYGLEEPDWKPDDAADRRTFRLTFDEYVRYREEVHHAQGGFQVLDVFRQLMRRPRRRRVHLDDRVVGPALAKLGGQGLSHPLRGILPSWVHMEPYWQWVAVMYGPEIVERFGGLSIVDSGLLPMGMVSIFREKRVTWLG